jgi:hypothetical protein
VTVGVPLDADVIETMVAAAADKGEQLGDKTAAPLSQPADAGAAVAAQPAAKAKGGRART